MQMTQERDLLAEAVMSLSSVCDGAHARDGSGFNGFDSPFGKQLAEIDPKYWTLNQRRALWVMVRKYKGQLANYFGINYDEIGYPQVGYVKPTAEEKAARAQEAEAKAKDTSLRRITWDGGNIIEIHFPYNAELVARVKEEIPGRRFCQAPCPITQKCARCNSKTLAKGKAWWVVPRLDAAKALTPWAQRNSFTIEERLAFKLQSIVSDAEVLKEQSKASSSDFEVKGLAKAPYSFQRAGIEYAIKAKRTFIADEMGLGKTIQSLGAVEALNAYPCLVVTPASLKYNWKDEIIGSPLKAPALPHRKAFVIDHKKHGLGECRDMCSRRLRLDGSFSSCDKCDFREADFVIINYDILSDGWDATNKKGIKFTPIIEQIIKKGIKSIIIDESHYIKNEKAQRTCALIEIAKQTGAEIRYALSGTPLLNGPVELPSQLDFLDRLQEFGGRWKFLQKYCGAKQGRWGWDFKGCTNAGELNERMRSTCYIRRLKKDVLKELPDKIRSTVEVEIDNRNEYDLAERELVKWIRQKALEDKEYRSTIAHLPEEEQDALLRARANDKAAKAARAEAVVKLAALKQVAAKGLLSSAKEWIDNFLDTGEKLVVFATHKAILSELQKLYPQAARIVAEDSPEVRQKNVARFQAEDSCNIIIGAQGTSANNSPAGVGHTLTASSNTLTIELGWNNALHDQCEDRCHRIGQKDTVNAWYLIGRNTIYEDLYELIQAKREVFTAVADGEDAKSQAIVGELLKRMEEKP